MVFKVLYYGFYTASALKQTGRQKDGRAGRQANILPACLPRQVRTSNVAIRRKYVMLFVFLLQIAPFKLPPSSSSTITSFSVFFFPPILSSINVLTTEPPLIMWHNHFLFGLRIIPRNNFFVVLPSLHLS